MTVYTWKGSTGLVTNPSSWIPTGVPATGDVGVITVGTALMINDTANPTYQFGDPYAYNTPGPTHDGTTPPTLEMTGHNVVTLDLFNLTNTGANESGPPLEGNVVATGNNTITAQIGSGPFNPQGDLTIRSTGNLTGNFTTQLAGLHITATGTVSGTYNINGYGAQVFTLDGGVAAHLTNAVVNDGTPFHGETPDSSGTAGDTVINATVGPNVTFNMNAQDTGGGAVILELGGQVTDNSDTINIGSTYYYPGFSDAVLQLDQPITFMRPPPEQITVKEVGLLGADVGGDIGFNTLPITAATYRNGVLSLEEAGHVMPMKITGLDTTNWSIIESAPRNGLVNAQLTYGYSNAPTGLHIPAGGQLIHVT